MVIFFKTPANSIIATQADHQLTADEQKELSWLYNNAELIDNENLEGFYVGPRREMITPWSTNAVEITQNMGLKGITRIEEYYPVSSADAEHDTMLQRMYDGLDQNILQSTYSQSQSSMLRILKNTTSRKDSHSQRRKSNTFTK